MYTCDSMFFLINEAREVAYIIVFIQSAVKYCNVVKAISISRWIIRYKGFTIASATARHVGSDDGFGVRVS